jgi:hypothetical protein
MRSASGSWRVRRQGPRTQSRGWSQIVGSGNGVKVADSANRSRQPRGPGGRPARTSSGFITEHGLKPGYDFGDEFEDGLDLVLDGLARRRREDEVTALQRRDEAVTD